MMRTATHYANDSRATVHVLIADDSPDDRAEIKAALLRGSRVRYQFSEADLGEEVIEKIVHTKGEICLLLDFHLPDMNALELMRRLKPDENAMLPCPVVVVTGSEQIEGGAQTAVRAGAMGFVGKDWLTPASLTGIVENAMERHALFAEKERLLKALQEREQQLSVAQRAARLGLWDWDIVADKAEWCDVAWALFAPGSKRETVSYKRWLEAIHPDDRERAAARGQQALLRTDEFYHDEFRIMSADGTIRWLQSSGEVIPEPSGQPRRFIGCVRDITSERDAAEVREQLLVAERAARQEFQTSSHLKDEFLATLAHELRNPLSNVISWSALLRKHSARDDAPMLKGLSIIENNARVQLKLIGDLLDVNRIVRGKVDLDLGMVGLDAFIEELVVSQRPTAETKGIDLRIGTRLPPESLVLADASRLHQIVGNILTNALKFTPRGGSVTVDLSAVENGYEIALRDTGEGITPEFLPHIFDRFRQGDANSARRKEGLGLGLAIVQKLVVLHGGTIRASSGGAGQGSTFTIRLPAASNTGHSGEAEALSCREVSLHDVHVVAVDDEPLILDYIKSVLIEHGVQVHLCVTAEDALATLSKNVGRSRHVILATDIGMPGEGGYGLLGRVRNELRIDEAVVPVLAITAFSREQDRVQAIQAGFQGFLTKPFDAAQLVSAIRELVASAVPKCKS